MAAARHNPRLIEKALDYHRDNPTVWACFESFAMQLIRAGRKQFSHGTLIERIRWEAMITTASDDFKINQNYGAFYARLFEHRNPEYKGVFARRTSCFDQLDMANVQIAY